MRQLKDHAFQFQVVQISIFGKPCARFQFLTNLWLKNEQKKTQTDFFNCTCSKFKYKSNLLKEQPFYFVPVISQNHKNQWCKIDGEKEDRGPNGDVGIEGNSASDGKGK